MLDMFEDRFCRCQVKERKIVINRREFYSEDKLIKVSRNNRVKRNYVYINLIKYIVYIYIYKKNVIKIVINLLFDFFI